MKIIILIAVTAFMCVSVFSQAQPQWTGSTDMFNTTGNKIGINNTTPPARLSVNNGTQTIAIGEPNSVSTPALNYATGYMGYNLYNSSTLGSWTLKSDGSHNGGTGMYSDIFGNLSIVAVPPGSTPSSDQTLSDATMRDHYVRLTLSPYSFATQVKLNVNQDYGRLTLNAVNTSMRTAHNYANSYLGFNVEDDGTGWWLSGDGGHNGGAAIIGTIMGDLRFYAVANEGSSGHTVSNTQMVNDLAFRINSSNVMSLKPVQIGSTTIPSGYGLSVDGKVICDEITVKLHTTWPDYVFNKGYKLPTLRSVETYMQDNGHLPEIPTAAEVSKDGLKVGEMNAALLKKIEELTLYVIELEKVNDEQSRLLKEVIERLDKQK